MWGGDNGFAPHVSVRASHKVVYIWFKIIPNSWQLMGFVVKPARINISLFLILFPFYVNGLSSNIQY